MSERRVVAEGWGHQSNGSVFCADSSLRFIYETHQAPQSAAAITSLAAGASAPHMHSHQHHHMTPAKQAPHQVPPQQQQQQTHNSFFMDQLKGANSHYYAPTTTTGYPLATDDCKRAAGGVFPGKRPRESSVDARVDGVDLHEAEIARACTAITKQVPSLPHSFRECSVCLSANAYAQIHVCGHTFHSKCFLRWFRMNRSCPLCRGPVDKVQLAPVVSVQDELEAIMAEIDDEPLDVDASKSLADPLMENPDLISFLESDFDTDMDMAALDDVRVSDLGDVSMMDMDMDVKAPAVVPKTEPSALAPVTHPFLAPAPSMQFAPSSTMPNYWNVLNQGLSCIPPGALLPQPPAQPQAPRMVHIAPKPDARALQSTPATSAHALAKSAATFQQQQQQRALTPPAAATAASSTPRVVSCRCTGGCRNGRCACVKEGGMCGVSCRCTSCKNPFLMVKAAGADIDALLQDSCFMHNVSKTRDMVQRLQEPVAVPCCGATITVLACVQGFRCAPCDRRFDFSWCMNKLLDSDKTPRNHCDICKRCCDHRDVHCNDCGRCYFAGVATSLPCPCKEASHHKKRRENAENSSAAASPSSSAKAAAAQEEEEEGEGECCIM